MSGPFMAQPRGWWATARKGVEELDPSRRRHLIVLAADWARNASLEESE